MGDSSPNAAWGHAKRALERLGKGVDRGISQHFGNSAYLQLALLDELARRLKLLFLEVIGDRGARFGTEYG